MSAVSTPLPNTSSAAWTIARALLSDCENHQAPLMVLAPDTEMAQDLCQELDAILGDFGAAEVFGSLETNLVRHRGPSRLAKSQRLRALCALHQAQPVESKRPIRVVVFSADALCQPQIRKSALDSAAFHLRAGDQMSRSSLLPRLAEMGYLPVEVVENEGTFAGRGSIVDLFCPTYSEPLRIELFGDEVQSLRLFDSKTQRKLRDLSEVRIYPSQEFFYRSHHQNAVSLFKAYADKHDWTRAERNEAVDRLEHQAYFSTLDYWARVFAADDFEETHEWLAREKPFDWILNPSGCSQGMRLGRTKQIADLSRARLEGEWVPEPDDFVSEATKTEESLRRLISTSRHQLNLGPTSAESGVESNVALASKIASTRVQADAVPLEPLYDKLRELEQQGYRVLFSSPTLSQLERLDFFLASQAIKLSFHDTVKSFLNSPARYGSTVMRLDSGFLDHGAKILFVTDEEIFGKRKKKATASTSSQGKSAASVFSGDLSLLTLEPGDFIAQSQHGVGIYLGLKSIKFEGVTSELIEIEYSGGNKLFVPVSRLNTVQRLGGKDTQIALDKLGGSSWESKKARAKRDIKSIATELIQLYSKRQLAIGPKIEPPESEIARFASTFPFEETPDQAKAIVDCLSDMRGPRPMDRVLCGDVGYGKTEVALRAAHAAIAAGFQVAILVPTTILAAQHENVFRKRLEPLGFKVRGLSRFKDAKEFKAITEGVRSGDVQLVVGTHRLLGDQVSFKNLGLLVIDEEQRFGVTHKEKLKRFKASVHVLTMTATPIPRTLNMALSGLRELSIISTPPVDRLSVKTFIARKKASLVQEAIHNELSRDGQVFYLHNRVQGIELIEEELKELVPGVRIATVHGQMDEDLLEKRMLDFYEGHTQVLLTTTIIESGLDVPNANTLIVERANHFGLSQLYQIRGRVGRSSQKAYAYFLLPLSGGITRDAEERLQVLETYQDLGSGFHIASHDLDIRGAGDLLGRSQSGHMLAIGFDTYVEILQECVAELQGEPLESTVDPEINIPVASNIPEDYIPDIGLRLSYYKKLASAESDLVFDEIEEELEDRFGRPPQSVLNLLRMMKIKAMLRRLGVKSMTSGKVGYSLVFDASTPLDTGKLVDQIARYPQNYQVSGDGKLIIKMPGGLSSPPEMLKMAETALEHLSKLV